MAIPLNDNTHWWPKTEKSRKRCLKVLQRVNRVITKEMVNSALPPLPPALWRRMRRLRPDLYSHETVKIFLSGMPEREWKAFLAACKTWKVHPVDVVLAFAVLFTRMVEQE